MASKIEAICYKQNGQWIEFKGGGSSGMPRFTCTPTSTYYSISQYPYGHEVNIEVSGEVQQWVYVNIPFPGVTSGSINVKVRSTTQYNIEFSWLDEFGSVYSKIITQSTTGTAVTFSNALAIKIRYYSSTTSAATSLQVSGFTLTSA